MQDVDCGRFREQASDYIENTLSRQQADLVAAHLRVCADCRRDEAALRGLYREMSRLPDVEPPLFFRENVIAAIEQEQKARSVAWWNAPAQWNRLTRTAVGTALATGAAFALVWTILLPRTGQDAPVQTADVFAAPDTKRASSESAAPRLHLSRTLTMLGGSTPAYDVQVWLSGADGTVRFRFPHDERDYRFNLRQDQAQPLIVPLSVAAGEPVLSLTAFWSAEGRSHTRHWFVPVADASARTTAPRQSFGLPDLTVADAVREVAERYAVAVTLDDSPAARVQINARQETALQTLTRHLEPLGLAVANGPDGIEISAATPKP